MRGNTGRGGGKGLDGAAARVCKGQLVLALAIILRK